MILTKCPKNKIVWNVIKNGYKFVRVDGEDLSYNSNFKKKPNSLGQKLFSNFKTYLAVKDIKFNTAEFENLDVLSLARIICVISPFDYLTKQMLLEFNNSDDFCENLISVLEIEIKNLGANAKIN